MSELEAAKKRLRETLLANNSSIRSHFVDAVVESRFAPALRTWLQVRPDSRDDRDLRYEPSLVQMPAAVSAPAMLVPAEGDTPRHRAVRRKLVRRQGGEGTCTGQALASAIDLLKFSRRFGAFDLPIGELLDGPRAGDFKQWLGERVSARMLYEMARALDDDPADRFPGSTVRNALKGFAHNGVCLDTEAEYEEGELMWRLKIAQAKSARKTSLGAYRRLNPILHDYHAALNDSGVVYVSAIVHDGWDGRSLQPPQADDAIDSGGACGIEYSDKSRAIGGHAFVVVGYTGTGFLVLNSFGSKWGVLGSGPDEIGIPGVAHWHYDDWERNALDAWVFSLAVPSSNGFLMRAGFLGERRILGQRATTTPRIAINGHYINIKNGRFVRTGALSNDEQTFKATGALLDERMANEPDKAYRHVLLSVQSGFDNIDSSAVKTAQLVRYLKGSRVYPLFLFWNHSLPSQVHSLVQGFEDDVNDRVGDATYLRARWFERMTRDYGELFKNRMDAQRARMIRPPRGSVPPPSDLMTALQPIFGHLEKHPQVRLHLVAHGDGAFVLDDIVKARLSQPLDGAAAPARQMNAFARQCDSVSLVTPLNRRKDIPHIERLARRWSSDRDEAISTATLAPDTPRNQVALYTLSHDDELRDSVGPYPGTFPRLVQSVLYGERPAKGNWTMGLHEFARERYNGSKFFQHRTIPAPGITDAQGFFEVCYHEPLLVDLYQKLFGSDRGAILT